MQGLQAFLVFFQQLMWVDGAGKPLESIAYFFYCLYQYIQTSGLLGL